MRPTPSQLVSFLLLSLVPLAAQNAAAPKASATDTSKKDEAVQLSVFTVSDDQDLGYESMHTTAGMRTVQELKNVANSISIMNSQLIEDLAVLNIEEMSRWFVTGEQSPDPAQPNQLIFRGVRDRKSTRLNSSHVSESRMPSSA